MTEGPADAVLVRAAQAGDPAGLGALLQRHRARMLAIAVSILGHGPEAEDAVQDACLIAVRRIGEVRDPAAARGWLAAIVINACRAQLRRRMRVSPVDVDVADEPGLGETVEDAVDALALRDWMWTALERLSAPLRLVTTLRYFTAASSYETIAEICGVPVGTVRSRLSAARDRLADELLRTAAQAHVHPGGAHDPHAAQIGEAMERFSRHGDRRSLDGAFSPDLSFVMFDRVERRGLDAFAGVIGADMGDGVTVRPVRVVTSSDVTVLEAWLDSPAENPLHCPPALTQVYLHPDGPVRRVVSHYAPREPGD